MKQKKKLVGRRLLALLLTLTMLLGMVPVTAFGSVTTRSGDSVELPNGVMNSVVKLAGEETISDVYYSEYTKYTIQIASGTEKVTFTFDEDASINFYTDMSTGERNGDIYYGTMVYSEDWGAYESGRWINTPYTENNGIYSIEIDVKKLIEGDTLYAALNDYGTVLYTVEFEYAATSSGHDCIWNSGEVTKEATCKETGIKLYRCIVTGCTETKEDILPLADHNWNSGVVDPEATCQTAGVKTYTCQTEGCGETKTEPIPASEECHKWSDWEQTKAPTCYSVGTEIRSCIVEGCEKTETKEISTVGHSWNEGEITKEATCKEEGTKSFSCTVDGCNGTKTEPVAQLTTHTYPNGTADKVCSVCGKDNPDYADPNMPEVDSNGVYQIGTAKELISFAEYVKKGNTKINAVLTANIDLTGETWKGIENFAGSFDGQGNTVKFSGATNGLFATVKGTSDSVRAEIKNVIVEGTISGSSNVGGIAGKANNANLTRCINRATISGTQYVAGIVGNATTNNGNNSTTNACVTITECGNEGVISATATTSFAGGIVGCGVGKVVINYSYNTKAISGSQNVGGISGWSKGYPDECTLSDCYNVGQITGTQYVGGLIGNMYNAVTATNCYNAGAVSGTNNVGAIAGQAYNKTNSKAVNCYYLKGIAGDVIATNKPDAVNAGTKVKTDEEMKAKDFVSALGGNYSKSNTYPILTWQVVEEGTEEYAVAFSNVEGVTFQGSDKHYSSNESYEFTVTINNRYVAGDDFTILLNKTAVDSSCISVSGKIYTCTISTDKITEDVIISAEGIEPTKTVVYQGNSLPVYYGYVSEIAVDDVNVTNVRSEGMTIYVTLADDTELDAEVYFTVAKGGGAGANILGITPGTSFTKQLSFGGLTQTIIANMPSSGTSEWTIVVSVEGIVSHTVTLPSGEGYQVHGPAAVIDGQNYTFTVEIDKKYTGGVVKVGDKVLTPNEDGSYTVKNVTADLEITVTGVERKPFESPLERIEIGGNVLDKGKIVLKTDDFHLGGKGESFGYRVYEEVPYYHVTVPKETKVVDVIFKAITDILINADKDDTSGKLWARGYKTDIDKIDAITSPTIRGTSFDYTTNEDGTTTIKIPVEGNTVNSSGGKAIGPEAPDNMDNRPVALFSFIYEPYTITILESAEYRVIPMEGSSTSTMEGDDFRFVVRPQPGYVKNDDFAVLVDEKEVTPDENGVYTIENVNADHAISATGIVKKETVTSYLSLSHDAEYMVGDKTGTVMALQPMEVPWFDLEAYGLGEYTIPSGIPGYQEPTVLHMYIYATEVYYCGIDEKEAGKGYLYEKGMMDDLLQVDDDPGSMYLKSFWGYDENLNYYHNYEFPKYEDGTGATADRMVLKEGDIITVGHFTSWKFHEDPGAGFNFLTIGNNRVVSSAMKGSSITVKANRSCANVATGDGNMIIISGSDIYYVKSADLVSGDVIKWTKLGTSDANGELTVDLTEFSQGQYILAMAGMTGTVNATDICSAPGAIILNVVDAEGDEAVLYVISRINEIGEVTLDDAEAIQAARNAYDRLNDTQQAQVANYTTLVKAEETLKQLQDEKADREAAAAAEVLIRAIGEVSAESGEAIAAARQAYDNLTDVQKALVNAEVLKMLTDAETTYAELTKTPEDEAAVKAVEEAIGQIGKVTLEKETVILAVRDAYEALTPTQKLLVSNLSTLEKAEEDLALLKTASSDLVKIYQETAAYLKGLTAPGVGSTNGEWRVIGLARSGNAVSDTYYNEVIKYVLENINSSERLHNVKSTENSRLILALTAIGKDVTNVNGHNLLAGLNDMTYIGKQGVNGTIWALIALDSHDYPISGNAVTRDKLIQAILDKQLSDGGWAMSGKKSDPDLTGMALQALAPYYSEKPNVKTAVDKALTWLSKAQNEKGCFSTSEGSVSGTVGVTSESLAQVIVALTSLGIDPEEDARFIKNGISALDALATYYLGNGGFKHGPSGTFNMMATEQAYYALTSYFRLLQDETSLYDMTDVVIDADDEISDADREAVAAVEALIKAIGTGSSPDKTKVKAARTAYNALTGVQKNMVKNYKVLLDAEEKLSEPEVKPGTGEFGLAENEIKGYVYVSFEDKGVRKKDELNDIESEFRKPLGTIVSKTKVPFKKGDTLASVTLRLLEYKGIGADYNGDEFSGFYLAAIEDFKVGSKTYDSFGEFDAGVDSGWMITWDDWFINQGASEFTVKNGDYVRWQYTCQLGRDIGNNSFSRDETPVVPEEQKPSASVTPEVSVNSKGEASVTIKKDELTSAVEEATKDNAAGTVVIAPEIKGDASKVTVELPKEAVESMATSGKTDLTVKTDIATVTLPAETLKDLPTEGKTVSVAVEKEEDKIKVEVAVDNKAVDKIGSGVVASIPAKEASPTTVLVIVDAEGNETIVKKSATAEGEITALLEGSCTVVVKDNKKEFADTEGHWGKSAVEFASSRELFNGVGNGKFGMNTTMNRAMMATVFYNLENGPDHDGEHDFHDVQEGKYYAKPVAWAAESGVLSGYNDGSFRADAPVTREQLAVMLWNYSGKPSGIKALDHSDAGNISNYAKEAMQWAVENGVMSGRANGQLDPKGAATRAEVAQMFKNYIEKVVL